MSLKLNKVADEIVLETLAFSEARLDKMLAPNSSARASAIGFARSVGHAYLQAGTAYYQQQRDPAKIREYLALAGHYLIEEATFPQELGREPNELERPLALAACFGQKEDVEKACSIDDAHIFTPNGDEMRRQYRLSLDYINLLRAYLSSGLLDISKVEQAKLDCKAANIWKFDAVETYSKLSALEAVAKSDAAQWNDSLLRLIAEHKEHSLRGAYQRLNLAFICLPALLLAKLGIDKGLKCTVSSPYLPIQLL